MKTKRFITMVAIILIIAISSLSAAEDDSTYIKGRAVIKVTNVFNQFSIGDDGYVETEKEWFNEMIPIYDITDVRQIGEKIIPAENLTNFLFYTVVFDTVHTVQEVQDVFAMSLYHISCAGEYDKDSDYESKN